MDFRTVEKVSDKSEPELKQIAVAPPEGKTTAIVMCSSATGVGWEAIAVQPSITGPR